jgi:hypothetical protein
MINKLHEVKTMNTAFRFEEDKVLGNYLVNEQASACNLIKLCCDRWWWALQGQFSVGF